MSSINYTHEYRNPGLPDNPMPLHNFRDVNDSIASIINQVKQLQAEGRYADAADLVTANNLKQYTMTTEYINMIDEETRNLEIMCKANQQSVYYMENEPGFASPADVWISSNPINGEV